MRGWSAIYYWSLSDDRLSLEWHEYDGPPVATPLHRGFGMQLLSRALDQFGGAVETIFEPTGLICKLSVALTEDSPNSRAPLAERRSALAVILK